MNALKSCLPVTLIMIGFSWGCRESKRSKPPVASDDGGLTDEQFQCIRQELAGTSGDKVHPYDAVMAFKACGGRDNANGFVKAAEAMFLLNDETGLTLK